jgi:hypothetical protein
MDFAAVVKVLLARGIPARLTTDGHIAYPIAYRDAVDAVFVEMGVATL